MASSNPRAVPGPADSDSGARVLPLDALYEILLRVPARALCRSRAVCRLWRSLLSEPHFAQAHAARRPEPLIIAGCGEKAGNDVDVLVDIMDLSGQIIKRVRRVVGDRVMSIPLDLVFVYNTGSGDCRLLNPATGAEYHLPDTDDFAEEHVAIGLNLIGEPTYMFGRVASTGEYKVLRMLFHFSFTLRKQLFEICTLNGSSSRAGWRYMEAPPDNIAFSSFTSVVMDEVVYILCWESRHSIVTDNRVIDKDLILTFNLQTEAWGPSIPGPQISFPDNADLMFDALGLPTVKQLTIANLNGSLVAVHGPAPHMDFWILMDFDKGLWVKQYTMQFDGYDLFEYVHPLLVLGDNRIVIHKKDMDFLQIYDPRTNTFTDSVEAWPYSTIAMYTGNLLSLEA